MEKGSTCTFFPLNLDSSHDPIKQLPVSNLTIRPSKILSRLMFPVVYQITALHDAFFIFNLINRKTGICSGVTAGRREAGCPPDTSHREISADLPQTLLTGKFLQTYGEKRGK